MATGSARRRFVRAREASQRLGAGRFGVWGSSTGVKMFVVLMLALLPLGVLAVVGTVQTIRTVEVERLADLSLSASESASRLLGEINIDRQTMRLVANSLESDPAATGICRRASAQLPDRARLLAFAMFTVDGRVLCRAGAAPLTYPSSGPGFFDQQATIQPKERRLLVRIDGTQGRVKGVISYDAATLAAMTGVRVQVDWYVGLELSRDGQVLTLLDRGERPDAAHSDRATAPLNLGALKLAMTTQRPPVDLLRFAATILPIFMWFAAAAVGWWVVNRYLIRPLIDLNAYVAAYQPGTMLGPLPADVSLAREITTLGETFRAIAEDVVEHEGQLANALVHQRALTREVHHRVKNNLQIIASLINLHSRASTAPEAAEAYASIQRRVDALSVVHRNHYASAEFSQGIDAQALISELASGLRGSSPGGRLQIKMAGDNLYLSQDVAVPVAFLITELVELAILTGADHPVLLALRRIGEGTGGDGDGMAELSVTSPSLIPGPEVDHLLAQRFERVLTGLSRQLRAPLRRDVEEGSYSIMVSAR